MDQSDACLLGRQVRPVAKLLRGALGTPGAAQPTALLAMGPTGEDAQGGGMVEKR